MTAEPRDDATPLLAESSGPGKPGHAPPRAAPAAPAPTRIGAIIAAATAELPPSGRLVEVGYDRGAILLGALAARPDARAIGVEIQPTAAAAMPSDPRCDWRTGDGLAPIAAPEAERAVAILAGMGGRTIAAILERAPALTRAFTALVLCPSHLEADIRPALARLGVAITNERLIHERDRFYEVIVARPSAAAAAVPAPTDAPDAPDVTDPTRAAWGPCLFARRDPLLRAFLEDARGRFHAAFAEDLRSYRSGAKAALGDKLARLEHALSLIDKGR